MLTVPTTPRQSNPGLPDPGGWPPVCLRLVILLRTSISERKSASRTGITDAIRSHPVHHPASINP
jgi:hypothetical protein